jgi:hypothetical protein
MSIKNLTIKFEKLNVEKNNNKIIIFENDCKKFLKGTNEKMNTLVNGFNDMILYLAKMMKQLLPKDIESKIYYDFIDKLIKAKPLEPISIFIDNVYSVDEYRISLKKKNDKFFIDNEHDSLTNKCQENVNNMFKFKTCWKSLDDETKEVIKQMMEMLVDLTEKYVIELDNKLEIEKIIEKTIKLHDA